MKIVFVIDQLDVGGAEQQLITLCHGLKNRQHDVGVISVHGRLGLKAQLDHIHVPVTVVGKAGTYDVSVAWRLRQQIRALEPDLVHAYLPTASLFTGMTKWLGVTAPVLASERGVNDWRSSLRILLENIVRRRVAHITCNAEAIKRHLVNVEGVHTDMVSVIYNGLRRDRRTQPADAAVNDARRLIAAPPGAVVVTCVANFSTVKQHHVLLRAFAKARQRAPNLFLVLVGKGPLEDSIRAAIRDVPSLRSVRIVTDCVSPLALLSASNIAILTSRLEGCSNALLEAMAVGLPVIASDVGGNPELVVAGKGGYVCPDADASAFADALVGLANDPALAGRMGDYNRRRVNEQFTDDAMVERTLGLYRKVLSPGGRAV